jgi:ABC-type amino acid transport substrate-binding protein
MVASVVLGMRLLFFNFTDTTYAKDEVIKGMSLMMTDSVPSVVHREPIAARELLPDQSRLETVMSSGLLRLCYRPDTPPFTYFNSRDELVGFDVEMANSLARGLDLTLEFLPLPAGFGARKTAEKLNSGDCDMVIGFPVVSMTWLGKVAYSDSYLDSTLAFLVEDHRRQEFKSREAIDSDPNLRVAFPDDPYYLEWAHRLLPNAQIIPVPDVETFLSAERGEYDAMLYAGEALAAYSLLNPEFGVVVPKPSFPSVPAAYVLPLQEPEWLETIDGWIQLKRTDGTIDALFDYWVRGEDAVKHEERWSVLRDVLEWTD